MTHAYLPHPDFIKELRVELQGHIIAEHGNVLLSDQLMPSVFALDIWPNVQQKAFVSIGDAVKILKPAAKFWMHYPISHIRRGTLIQEQLRQLPVLKPIAFPLPALPEIAVFSLLDQNTLLYCPKPWKAIPGGEYHFKEDKINPPNRAYLKLWEALSIWGQYPKPGELCMDLGASPGGWTWVLQQLGAKVIAVDKAPLAPNIAALPTTCPGNAPKLPPSLCTRSSLRWAGQQLFTSIFMWARSTRWFC